MSTVLLLPALLIATTGRCGIIECGREGGGAFVGLSQEQVVAMADQWPDGSGAEQPDSWFEYVGVIDCRPPNTVSEPRLEICQRAMDVCDGVANLAFNVYSVIYRRTVGADGVIDDWAPIGGTCFTDSVPARSGEPAQALTDAMIIEQFHRTDFALPDIVLQPPDGATLVNLPVYFQLAWPDEGFAPEEIDTTTIVGHEVRIRPTLVGATYLTGDGQSIGPTTSLGGPYPSGDVTHTYTARADVSPSITVEYGGEVSVDGGEWRTIPGSATVEGPSTPLQVLTSRNRLYTN